MKYFVILIIFLGFMGPSFTNNAAQWSFAETTENPNPLQQIKNGTPLHMIKCSEGKIPSYKFDMNKVACVSEKTHAKLVERGWAVSQLGYSYQDRGVYLCDKYQGIWFDENELCKNISQKQCSLMGGSFLNSESACTTFYEYYLQQIEDTEITLEGLIINQRLGPSPNYHLFTNEPYLTFNTGSNGIKLNLINSDHDLNGAIVKLSGTHAKRDLGINVKDIEIQDSLIPKGNIRQDFKYQVTLEELVTNPDLYYNQTVVVSGNLKEHENDIAFAGVGCYTARYDTSDEFLPDFPSSRHLSDGNSSIGVRIGTPNDLGKVDNPLPDKLKSNKVSVSGIFVPNVVETGQCQHVIHKSGYLLTDLKDIHAIE